MFGSNKIHANFSVDDLEVAREFYEGKLGFKVTSELDGNLVLEAGGGTTINIYEKESHAPWDSTVLGISVDDVQEAVGLLADAGITIEKVPMADDSGIAHMPGVGDAAWFKDPAANWVCVTSMV